MFNVELSEEYIVRCGGTSEGTQVKYFKDGYWYKEDHSGREGLAEYLVSRLLTFSDLPVTEYVAYEQGYINGKGGCRSRSFLAKGEELITIYRLYFNEYGRDLSQVINQMDSMEDRIEYTLKFVRECCSVDIFDYFAKVFTLDRIVLDEDRHLNNLALVYDGRAFRPSPIFDNGVSLLTTNRSVNWNFSMAENVKRVVARPFSGSFDRMHDYFGNGICFRKTEAARWLQSEPQSMERDVLLYQLEQKAEEVK